MANEQTQLARILIVEDEGVVAADLECSLKDFGYDVVGVATTADEAVLEAARSHPDLALMDIRLSGTRDGIEAASVLKDRFNTPLIYLTAHGDPQTFARARSTLPMAFILKPIRYDQLRHEIDLALGRVQLEEQAGKKLQVSERRYRTLVEASSSVTWRTNGEGKVDEDLPVLRAFTGQSPREILQDGWADAVHPDDRARVRTIWAGCVQDHTRFDAELRLRRRDGEYRDMATRAVPIVAEDSSVLEWVGACQDVTDRKQAEARTHEEEAKFRSLVEQNIAGIGILRQDGTIAYVNARFSEMIGYPTRDLVGRSILDFFWETEKATAGREMQMHFAGAAGLARLESAMRRSTGEKLEILLHASRTVYEGKPASIGTVIDITGRKRAEQTLRASEERFRLLVENAPDAILIYDSDGHCFIDANAQAERLFGCPREEIVGHGPAEFFAPEQPDGRPVAESIAEHDRMAGTGASLVYERIVRGPGGEDRICQVSMVGLPGPGARLRRVSFIDITERKQSERNLARLNRALRTLSRGNEVVVRSGDESQLLDEMCRAAVESGGYRLALIGMVEHDEAKTVRIAAYAGPDAGRPAERLNLTWDDASAGCGTLGLAIRSGEPQICQDLLADPCVVPWAELAKEFGVASVIALPLKDSAGVFAVLLICSNEANAFDADELKLLGELAGDLSWGIQTIRERARTAEMEARWRKSLQTTVAAIANTVELRDPYTAGHQQHVARLAVAIAGVLGVLAYDRQGIHLAGILHDVGKINVPSEILSKPGRLSPLELALIRQHVETGYNIVKSIDFPWPIAEMVRQHHERLDGSGYPRGLKGDAILPGAKILAVADTVDAMTSHRPYRPSCGIEAALAQISAGRSSLFDPAAVDACIALFRERGFSFDAPEGAGHNGFEL